MREMCATRHGCSRVALIARISLGSRDIRRAFGLYEFPVSARAATIPDGEVSLFGGKLVQVRTTKTGTFMAVDRFGKRYTVNEWTNFQDASGHGDDAERWEPVPLAFRLDNGDYVQLLDDDTILVLRTGTRLRVAQPAASARPGGQAEKGRSVERTSTLTLNGKESFSTRVTNGPRRLTPTPLCPTFAPLKRQKKCMSR